jgi:hypothetical protein
MDGGDGGAGAVAAGPGGSAGRPLVAGGVAVASASAPFAAGGVDGSPVVGAGGAAPDVPAAGAGLSAGAVAGERFGSAAGAVGGGGGAAIVGGAALPVAGGDVPGGTPAGCGGRLASTAGLEAGTLRSTLRCQGGTPPQKNKAPSPRIRTVSAAGIQRDGRKRRAASSLAAMASARTGAPVGVVMLAAVSAVAAGEPGATQTSSSSVGAALLPVGRRIVTRRTVAVASLERRAISSAGAPVAAAGPDADTPSGAGAVAPRPSCRARSAMAVRIACSSVGCGPGGGAGSRLIFPSVALYAPRASWEQHHAIPRRPQEPLSAPGAA